VDKPFPAYKGDEPYVFVSYSHRDSLIVFPEIIKIKAQGFNVWYDEGIEAGTEWREELANAIEGAKLVVYFVTGHSVQSENCRKEVNFAVDAGIPIVAIHLEAVELPSGLKLTLSDRQAILKNDMTDEKYQQKLHARIASYLDQASKPVAVAVKKKTKPVVVGIVGLAIVAILSVGLFFYNPQSASDTESNKIVEVADLDASAKMEADELREAVEAMRSIAVLPFVNMTTSEEIGFLADGLSEDILDNLAQVERLKVASRSASFQFAARGVNPSLVGEQLGVGYLLEGSVRQQGETLRITAQLIRTNDGSHVWSKTYERTIAEGFDMQTAVAVSIANIAQSELNFDIYTNYELKQQKEFVDIDPIAVKHYMNAMNELGKLNVGEGGNWDTLTQLLKNAIDVDSSFLLAYTMLAHSANQGHGWGSLSLQTARPAAHFAIDSAIKLDQDNHELQFQLAQIHLYLDLDYARAGSFFAQRAESRPQYPLHHVFLAEIDLREGRASESLRRLATAAAADITKLGAQQAIFFFILSNRQCMAGDCEGALSSSAKAIKLLSGGEAKTLGLTAHINNLLALGRVEEARPLIDEAWRLDGHISPERYIYAFAMIGETAKARDILADSRYEPTHHFYLALGHLSLGDIDKTFAAIEGGIEEHNRLLIISMPVAAWWDPIRDDPRFNEMLALLDAKVTHTEQYLKDHKISPAAQ
jgi:TolB-like protein